MGGSIARPGVAARAPLSDRRTHRRVYSLTYMSLTGLRATLHALRDRLPIEETAELAAQLPMLVRGFYYEGWDPTGKPVRERSLEGFLAGVAVELPIDADPEPVARAVFALLARRVSDGEIQDVKGVLPTAIRQLWPAAPRAA